jgi:dihydroorotate dehydrogenase electron transfer subunit
LIYGARSKNDLNLLEKLETHPLEKMFLFTDDGSAGKQGDVTTDVKKIITENSIETTISRGPDAMFENLSPVLKKINTDNYASLESLMGCGFGICYSCVVKTRADGYKKVCQDGPIFKLDDIEW